MFCGNCGEKIDGDSVFCKKCGARTDDYTLKKTPEATTPPAQKAPEAPSFVRPEETVTQAQTSSAFYPQQNVGYAQNNYQQYGYAQNNGGYNMAYAQPVKRPLTKCTWFVPIAVLLSDIACFAVWVIRSSYYDYEEIWNYGQILNYCYLFAPSLIGLLFYLIAFKGRDKSVKQKTSSLIFMPAAISGVSLIVNVLVSYVLELCFTTIENKTISILSGTVMTLISTGVSIPIAYRILKSMDKSHERSGAMLNGFSPAKKKMSKAVWFMPVSIAILYVLNVILCLVFEYLIEFDIHIPFETADSTTAMHISRIFNFTSFIGLCALNIIVPLIIYLIAAAGTEKSARKQMRSFCLLPLLAFNKMHYWGSFVMSLIPTKTIEQIAISFSGTPVKHFVTGSAVYLVLSVGFAVLFSFMTSKAFKAVDADGETTVKNETAGYPAAF